jgi:2-keto-3-deoxy-L-rhamnonate aldolase RhmA
VSCQQIDLQHGISEPADAATNLRVISHAGKLPLVRLASQDAGMIGRVLDFGAMGVIVPMVNTAEQVCPNNKCVSHPLECVDRVHAFASVGELTVLDSLLRALRFTSPFIW